MRISLSTSQVLLHLRACVCIARVWFGGEVWPAGVCVAATVNGCGLVYVLYSVVCGFHKSLGGHLEAYVPMYW